MTENKETLQTVAIFWDIENCPVPRGVRVDNVATNICMALQGHYPMRGPVKVFSAYGNFRRFHRGMKEECTNSGVNLIDVPSEKKAAADKAILLDMFLFAIQNPPPCIILLISADLDFAPALHKLGLRGYTMVLAVPNWIRQAPSLQSACQLVFTWEDVARGGESLKKPDVYMRNADANSKQYAIKCDNQERHPYTPQTTEKTVELSVCSERADARHGNADIAKHEDAPKKSRDLGPNDCNYLEEHRSKSAKLKNMKKQSDSMLKCREGHISKPKHKGENQKLQRQVNNVIHHPRAFNINYTNAANHTDQSAAQLNPNNALPSIASKPLNYEQRPFLPVPSSLERHISSSLGPPNRPMQYVSRHMENIPHLQTIRPFPPGIPDSGNFSGHRVNGVYDVRGMRPVYDLRGMRPGFHYPPAFCPPKRPSFCPQFHFPGPPPPRF